MLNSKCVIDVFNEKIEVLAGTSFLEIARTFQDQFKYPIIAVRVNGHFRSLNEKIQSHASIEFYDLTSRDANRIYLHGLMFLLIYSTKIIYGSKLNITIKHSIDKGMFCETDRKITKEDVKKIHKQMQLLVEDDLPISLKNVRRVDAIEYFKAVHEDVKADLLRYTTNTFVSLYKLGDMYDYFFSPMPISTGALKDFDLTYVNEKGFVLLFPTIYRPGEIKPYVHHPNLFRLFNEYHNWASVIGVKNVVDLNKLVSGGKIDDLIRLDEAMQSSRLLEVAKVIYSKKNHIKIILIAGPSSSGKTTTSMKLSSYLRSFGFHPVKISMDDYFLHRDLTPRKADGTYDFECIEALDLKLFEKQMIELLDGKEVMTPKFDFVKGEPNFIQPLKLASNDLLIIEGIHALNPVLLEHIDKKKKFKIYVTPATALNIDNHNRISTSDNRMIRRMIRDNRTRGNPPLKTIMEWPSVREGEEKYIFPFQDEADWTLNTALLYEIGVLRTYAEPLLYTVPIESEYYEEAKRIINILKNFLPISPSAIPDDSILREFIGDSCYKGE